MLLRGRETSQSLRQDEYEILRAKFRPRRIKVLFIGESRPANGTFFYRGDSRLARYTREAMGDERGSLSTFLKRFESLGCFLLDLCSEPVNGLPPSERRNARKHGVQTLGEKLQGIEPFAIIVVMKGIGESVTQALRGAGLERVPRYVLPFPSTGTRAGIRFCSSESGEYVLARRNTQRRS
jgi:hypothetical protein